MRLRRRRLLASVAGMTAAGLAGCGGRADSGAARTDTVTAAPVPQSSKTEGVTTVVGFDNLGPVNLSVAPSGDAYMAMGLSGQIRRLRSSRIQASGLTTDATDLVATLDTGNGFLYALDIVDDILYAAVASRLASTHGIWRVSLDDETPTRVTEFDPGVRVRALAADNTRNRLLVTQARTGVVSTVSLDSGRTTRWLDHRLLEADLRGPAGLALTDETVYISNNESARVIEVTVNDGATTGPPTVLAEDAALLSGASGLATDGSSLYVAVANLNRIVRVDGDRISTLASARDSINRPTDVALTPEGDALLAVNFGFEQMSGLTGNPSLVRVPL